MRIHLNCAVSRDGFLAGPGGKQVMLSDEVDLRRVHALRARHDAILVGSGTVLADDPSLRVNPSFAHGADPLRVVLDRRGRVPATPRVFADDNVVVLRHAQLADALEELESRGVGTLMVEGGAHVWRAFWKHGWSEATIYEAPRDLGGGVPLPGYHEGTIDGRVADEAVAAGEGRLLRWLNPT